MGLQQLAPQVVPIRFRHYRFAAESRRNPLYTYDETALVRRQVLGGVNTLGGAGVISEVTINAGHVHQRHQTQAGVLSNGVVRESEHLLVLLDGGLRIATLLIVRVVRANVEVGDGMKREDGR